MIASGVSVRHSVSPGWPFWPPGFLPEGSRRLLTRTVFFSPSLDGGLPLLLLFKLSRRSNSAMRACIAAISAAWRASSANNDGSDAKQDRSQRRAWDRADHAHRLVSCGACEDPVLPILACAAERATDGDQ